jgi:hypothetical protein
MGISAQTDFALNTQLSFRIADALYSCQDAPTVYFEANQKIFFDISSIFRHEKGQNGRR